MTANILVRIMKNKGNGARNLGTGRTVPEGRGELVKKVLLLAGVLTIFNSALLGQTVELPRMIHHKGEPGVYMPPQEVPQGMTEIYSSLGSDPKNLYDYIDTWLVAGPNSVAGFSNFVAMPFTPKSNAHVLAVRTAVLWYGSGAEQVNLSIYQDSQGAPGKLLAGPVTVTNLPKAFSCCQLAVADFSSGVPVNGGTQYWVVADTPTSGQGSNFLGEWASAVSPVLPLSADADRTGWVTFSGNGLPAGDVQGTIP